jgi:C4-dicarboxylate transporter, DctM subunit
MEVFLVPFLVLILCFVLGIPIAFSLGTAGFIGLLLITKDVGVSTSIIGLVTYDAVSSYILSAIPMFILMAYLTSSTGLAGDMFKAAQNWTSRIRGGVAVGTVFACGTFGAMSGASLAAASVMSEIAVPSMRKLGYSDTLIGGVVSVGSTLDILIPPSVFFVIYGVITETSVSQLLLAGILPGIVLGLFLIMCIMIWVSIRPQDAPQKGEKIPFAEKWKSLYKVWPSILIIVAIMGLLYGGIATPTEVAGLGACLTGLAGLLLGRLNLAGLFDAFRGTIRTTVMIFMMLIGAYIFGYYVTQSGAPQKMLALVQAMEINRWLVMVAICVSYFVLSMFMDELPLVLIYLQITFPLITSLGFNPIWYGVVIAILQMMGLVFPPVGLIAFVVTKVGKIELQKVYTGSSVLIVAIVLTLVSVMVFPEIALWIPSRMR